MTAFYRGFFGLAILVGLSAVSMPAGAQAPPFQCLTSVAVTPAVRAEGLAESVGDIVLSCTGGVPTSAGVAVPQVIITIFLNTDITSKVTASGSLGVFSEALLLIDEPNSTSHTPPLPLLNCGQTGAPDNGGPGPGVCETIATGDPAHSYDGSANTNGAVACDGVSGTVPRAANSYGCGRPNAFQGRVGAFGNPTQPNAITFQGVPLDPPGAGTRTLRFTNFRANAALIGVSPTPNPITASVAVNGPTNLSINNPQQTVAYVISGLAPGCGAPAASTVRLCEGFASSWKTKNVSFFVGDHNGTSGNATFSLGSYLYNGGTNYPADDAQNVPGVFYNTETGVEWQNNTTNAPPFPNPPLGFGGSAPSNQGSPLGSVGYGGTNTNIGVDGIANSATRVAVKFRSVPAGASIQVPTRVSVFRQGCTSLICLPDGVLALTNADAAGAGPYSAATSTTLGPNNLAVFEVLWTDPFSLEYADVPYTVAGGSSSSVTVTTSFAPFYSDPASGRSSSTAPVPRFAATAVEGVQTLSSIISGFGLPGGTTASLTSKLNAALADLNSNNLANACGDLGALINQANAQSAKQLTVAQANAIINAAMQLRAQLGC